MATEKLKKAYSIKNAVFTAGWMLMLLQSFCLELSPNPFGAFRFTIVFFILLIAAAAYPLQYSIKEIVIMGAIGICATIIFWTTKDSTVFWAAIFIACSKGIKIDSLVKKMLLLLTVLFVLTLCAAKLGMLQDHVTTNGMLPALKHTLGFSHPNTTQMMFMVIITMLIAVYCDQMKQIHLIGLMVLNTILYMWTHCRTSAITAACILLLAMLFKAIEKYKDIKTVEIIQLIINISMLAVILGILLIPLLYNGQNSIMQTVNRLVTGRITRGLRFFTVYSLRPLGNYIPELRNETDYIDIGYWGAILEYGIIFAAAFIAGEMVLLRRFRKQHRIGPYLAVLCMLIHMCGERMMLKSNWNFTYLWIAALIYTKESLERTKCLFPHIDGKDH